MDGRSGIIDCGRKRISRRSRTRAHAKGVYPVWSEALDTDSVDPPLSFVTGPRPPLSFVRVANICYEKANKVVTFALRA